MRFVLLVFWIGFGALELTAFKAGLNLWAGFNWLAALLIMAALITIPLPYVGILSVSVVAFVGATQGLSWPWWQADLALLPFAALSVVIMGASGTFDIFTSRPARKADDATGGEAIAGIDLERQLKRTWKPRAERPLARSGPFEDAFAGLEPTDYADRILRPVAEAGSAAAQVKLAGLYAKGEGIAQDFGESVWWYRRASEQGDATAQYSLGKMFISRSKSPEDSAKAVKWFRLAAERGHADAQYIYAGMHANGMGVPLNKSAAAGWYQKAAEQCHPGAQLQMGIMLAKGDGVREDAVQALTWFEAAARQGNGEARKKFDVAADGLDEERVAEARSAAEAYSPVTDEAEKDAMPPAVAGPDFAKAVTAYEGGEYATAVDLLQPLAAAGHRESCFGLGVVYAAGHGVDADLQAARDWFSRAADKGHIKARYELGVVLAGRGVVSDVEAAAACFRQAAEQGYAPAQRRLGVACASGLGVVRDVEEADKWLQLAVQQGDAEAQYELGDRLARGDGMKQDRRKGLKLLERAAQQGYVPAQSAIGFMYYTGDDLQDEGAAMTWYNRAAEQGDPTAKYSLSILSAIKVTKTRSEMRQGEAAAG